MDNIMTKDIEKFKKLYESQLGEGQSSRDKIQTMSTHAQLLMDSAKEDVKKAKATLKRQIAREVLFKFVLGKTRDLPAITTDVANKEIDRCVAVNPDLAKYAQEVKDSIRIALGSLN